MDIIKKATKESVQLQIGNLISTAISVIRQTDSLAFQLLNTI